MKVKELLFVSQETISLEQCSSENLKENRPLFAMCRVPGVRWCLSAHELAQWPEMWTRGGTCAAARVAADPRHTPGPVCCTQNRLCSSTRASESAQKRVGRAQMLKSYLFICLFTRRYLQATCLSVCLPGCWLAAW